jgi:hypothetical protein
VPRISYDALRPTRGPVRLVRSSAGALACVATAATGHVTAGGTMTSTAVVATFAGSAAIAWLLSARRVTPGQLVGLLLLCQVAVHLGGSADEMAMTWTMLAAHTLATAVSALLLARGEALVWRLAERVGRVRTATLRPAPVPRLHAPTPADHARSLRDVRLTHSRVERGPPSGS